MCYAKFGKGVNLKSEGQEEGRWGAICPPCINSTKGRPTRLILANLGPQPQVVRLEGAALPRELTVRGLDLEGVEEAGESPLRFLRRPGHRLLRRGALELPLEPCALLCLDAG